MDEIKNLFFDLSFASQDGDLTRVKELIYKGADPSIDDDENTALVDAINGRHPEVVEELLKSGANPDRRDPIANDLPLRCALAFSDKIMLRLLVEYGVTIEGQVLLDVMPQCDNPNLISAAIEIGFDPNYVDETRGRTPLHVACMYGYDNSIKALLESGSIVNVLDKKGVKPHELADINGHYEIVEYLQGMEQA